MSTKLLFIILIIALAFAQPYPKARVFKINKNWQHIINPCQLQFNNSNHIPFDTNYYLEKIQKRFGLDCKAKSTFTSKNIWKINIILNNFQTKDFVNERYKISMPEYSYNQNNQIINIEISSYHGYVRALETFYQTIQKKYQDEGLLTIPHITLIYDEPLFQYRGIMLDTARHFISKKKILQIIEAMPLVKLNTLHLHFTDDDAFTLALKSHPQLSQFGAYDEQSVYTYEDLNQIIAHAKLNGVYPIPQIDSPSHIRSWFLSKDLKNKNYSMNCKNSIKYAQQMDISKAIPAQIAKQVAAEIENIFRDSPLIHLGGDGISQKAWNTSSMNTFKTLHNLKNFEDVQLYWRYNILKATKKQKAMFWQDQGVSIKTAINQYVQYTGRMSQISKDLNASSSRVILSPIDYTHLNSGLGTVNGSMSTLDQYQVWHRILYEFNTFPEGLARQRVFGVQMLYEGPTANEDNLDNTIWMRAALFGFRLWSEELPSLVEIMKSIQQSQKQLMKLGIQPAPQTSQFCERNLEVCFADAIKTLKKQGKIKRVMIDEQ